MAQQNNGAAEEDKALEIAGAPLIAGDEASEVLQPGKEPFDVPAAFVATQGTAILSQVNAVWPMRGDELDAVDGQGDIERVAIVGGIPDQPRREVEKKAALQGLFDQRYFVRRRRGGGNGDRKTSAVCNGHDLGPFAAFGRPDVPPFFLALAKEPSMKVSRRSRPPRAWRSRASA